MDLSFSNALEENFEKMVIVDFHDFSWIEASTTNAVGVLLKTFLLISEKISYKSSNYIVTTSEWLTNTLGGKLVLLGELPYKEHLKLHEGVWGLLFPSICVEPLPYAIAESMLIGTIPIASKVGGIPEIVEGTYAERLTFTPGCPEEMADKMKMVLSLSQGHLVDVSSKLRRVTLKRFDNEEVKQKLLKVFSV